MNVCAEKFVDLLKSRDYQFNTYETNSGDSVVDFPMKGKVVKMVFSGDTTQYLSIYLVYERAPEDKFAEALFVCNELNCKYKWATFYIDDDKDIIIHDDAILSVDTADEEAFELMVRILRISDDVKPVIMRALYA